ncbi:MAG: type II toxin-antitoxin system HicA family toxin [Armatimonadia bacterium]
MPRVSGKALASALEKAGFVRKRVHGDHATYQHPETGHIATVPLKNRALPIGTISSILRQTGLTPERLRELL